MEVTLHEITHVLGFSNSVYKDWFNPITQNIYGTGSDKIYIDGLNFRGHLTKVLTSHNLLEFARQYYNCSTMVGVQLENNGGEGTSGSHFESSILENEYMTG